MNTRFTPYLAILAMAAALAAAGCADDAPEHEHAAGLHASEPHDRPDMAGEAYDDGHDHEAMALPEEHDHQEAGGAAHQDVDAGGNIHDTDDTVHEHTESADHETDTPGNWEDIIHIETAPAEVRSLYVTLAVPGAIVPDPDRTAMVGTVIDATINQVFANVGDRVERGALLACLISPDIGLMRAEYDRAEAELAIQARAFERSERLFAEDIIPERAQEEADRDLSVAQVTREYAYQRLRAVGLDAAEIESDTPCSHGGSGSSIHLRAPISGVITERSGVSGENVDASHRLFRIVDLESVWLEADLFEKDLTGVQVGDRVRLLVAAYDTLFTGTVFDIGDTVAETTRTVQLRAVFDNPGALLKPGMFASAEVVTGVRENTLVVPREAVLEQDGVRSVFVREGAEYHRHTVETGIEQDGVIEITGGLSPGDAVVTTGGFQLASQAMMNGIDPHAGHNH